MTNRLRIPCKEQYAYIEVDFEGTSDEAIVEYTRLTKMIIEPGIDSREFNLFLDTYLTTGEPPEDGVNIWERMSTSQKITINEVKKAFKRIKSKSC